MTGYNEHRRRGTTFKIYLPAAVGEVDSTGADDGAAARGTETIEKPFTDRTLARKVREVLDG